LAKISSQIPLFNYFVKQKTSKKEEVHNSLAILQSQIASARGWIYMAIENQGITKLLKLLLHSWI
jgi:hypothetical protein